MKLIQAMVSVLLVADVHGQVWTYVNKHPFGATYSVLNGAGAAQQVGTAKFGDNYHAIVWSWFAPSANDLNPQGATNSYLTSVNHHQQVGGAVISGATHAGLWTDTAASFVDLNPANANSSYLNTTDGSQQAGYAMIGDSSHAGLWAGTAASFRDFNPTGATSSAIYALSSVRQVGSMNSAGGTHALLWNGSANAYTDLHPAGFTLSIARSISPSVQPDAVTGGFAQLANGNYHACIWRGTAASFVDLNPAGLSSSQIYGVDEFQQVGIAIVNGTIHAAYWTGTAGSYVDLHAVLPDHYSVSDAFGVWTNGATTYVVGEAINKTTNVTEAILWKLSPSPIPTVSISGKKRILTSRARITIKGYASEIRGNLARVEVAVARGGFRLAVGTTSWKATVPLRRGRNVIQVRAVDSSGILSAPVRLIATRS